MKALIDTCVILDAIQERQPFASAAQEVFRLCAADRCIGCISAKSVTDVYYLVHKWTHNDMDSRGILQKLVYLFAVLDTAGIDCRKAILSDLSDYEDAVMVETAMRCRMDCIVTRNEKDFRNCAIPVYHPDEFCKMLKQ